MKHHLTVFDGIYAPAVNLRGVPNKNCAERGCLVHTYDWRREPGDAENTHRIAPRGTRVELVDALTRTWEMDAHAVAWSVAALAKTPRVKKDAVAWFAEQVGEAPAASVLIADVDLPDHRAWTPADRDEFEALWATSPMLVDAGMFFTRSGWRIVQPLDRLLPHTEFEPVLWQWLQDLHAAGVPTDRACRDWTRLFRLARVQREDRRTRMRTPQHGEMRIERMREIPVPVVRALPAVRARSRAEARARPEVPPDQVTCFVPESAVGDPLRAKAAKIAEAVRQVGSVWHELFLAIAGALCELGVPPEQVPALCGLISDATGADTRRDDRVTAGQTTVARWLARLRVKGVSALDAGWPDVARAVLACFGSKRTVALLSDDSPPPPPGLPVAEAVRVLEGSLRDAGDEVVCVRAPCGLGKTTAAERIAAERSRVEHPPGSEAVRAPRGSKTAFSVDKNDLALQVVANLAREGVAAKRFFGPLSLRRADGERECRLYGAARHLAAGGQSVVREFCEGRGRAPCPYKHACRAWQGFEGPDDARVAVGPHQLLGALDAFAGASGLLVIDEPPSLVDGVALVEGDFDLAHNHLDAFEDQYAAAMKPLLVAVRTWVLTLAPTETLFSVDDAVRGAVDVLDSAELDAAIKATGIEPSGVASDDALACARAALAWMEKNTRTPPIKWSSMARARGSEALAQALGAASRVLGVLYRATRSDPPMAFRVDETGKGRACTVSQVREAFAEALRRDGPCVVTDANVDLHLDVIERCVGYKPRVVDLHVADGAPVTRTLLQRAGANRRGWFAYGRLVVGDDLLRGLGAAVAWALEDPAVASVGLITFHPLRLVIEAAHFGANAHLVAAWREAGQLGAAFTPAVEAVGEVLAPLKDKALVLGHYRALRGLNVMADVDALVTLGDPWPNLGDVRHACAVLGIDGWEERFHALARAELEQAQGRLRTVHRARPGRACHVGSLLPSGASWHPSTVDLRLSRSGRPPRVAGMTAEELRAAREELGWTRARLADELQCPVLHLRKYEQGATACPVAVADLVRAIVTWDRHQKSA